MVELLPSAFVGHFRNYIVLFKTHQWSHHQTYALVCPRKLSVVVAELEALIFVCGVESSSLTMPAQSLNHSCLGFTLLGPSWGQGEWISCDLHLWHPAPLSSFTESRGAAVLLAAGQALSDLCDASASSQYCVIFYFTAVLTASVYSVVT